MPQYCRRLLLLLLRSSCTVAALLLLLQSCDGADAAQRQQKLASAGSSVALILRVASLEERHDAQNDETTSMSIHFPPCIKTTKGRAQP